MKEFRYSLRKGGRKELCPSCGKRTFKPYVDNLTQQPLDARAGRCERINHCRYHVSPRDVMAWKGVVASGYGGYDVARRVVGVRERPDRDVCFIPKEDMLRTMRGYGRNPLLRYLHGVFDPLIGVERVDATAASMGVGTSRRWGGSTVYWQIDRFGRIRTGKIMGYDASTGCRIKSPENRVAWVHSLERYRERGAYRGCFFGEHLLAGGGKEMVLLMESEKGALVAALFMEWLNSPLLMLPLGAGGCSNLSAGADYGGDAMSRISALKGRRVMLAPDADVADAWYERGKDVSRVASETHLIWTSRMQPLSPSDGLDDFMLRTVIGGDTREGCLLIDRMFEESQRI